ncbi:Glucose-1-phosphate cytidylyltransferase [compost metagenome]
MEPGIFDYIGGDETTWEYDPMRSLAQDGQLMSHTHRGFWQAMDTLRDRSYLEERWKLGEAQWRVWP